MEYKNKRVEGISTGFPTGAGGAQARMAGRDLIPFYISNIFG